MAFLYGVLTDIHCVIRSTTLYTMSHNFLHNLQVLQTNPEAHLASCSMATRAPSARVMRSGFEAEHATLSSVRVENEYSRYTSSVVLHLQYAIQFNSMHRDNFSFISFPHYKDCNIQEITVSVNLFLAPYGNNTDCLNLRFVSPCIIVQFKYITNLMQQFFSLLS
jgi:hypothetical protein